jgi:hypothetical protein
MGSGVMMVSIAPIMSGTHFEVKIGFSLALYLLNDDSHSSMDDGEVKLNSGLGLKQRDVSHVYASAGV